MITISTRRGLYLSGPNSDIPATTQIAAFRMIAKVGAPSLANIPAFRLLRDDETHRIKNGTKPLPIVGRVPSVEFAA